MCKEKPTNDWVISNRNLYIKSVKDKYYLNFEEINDVKERYVYLLKLFWIPKANIPSQAVGNKLELYIVL